MGHRKLEAASAAHLPRQTVIFVLAQEHDVVYSSDEVASLCAYRQQTPLSVWVSKTRRACVASNPNV
eukprot:2557702-Amphidinium_carterae.1